MATHVVYLPQEMDWTISGQWRPFFRRRHGPLIVQPIACGKSATCVANDALLQFGAISQVDDVLRVWIDRDVTRQTNTRPMRGCRRLVKLCAFSSLAIIDEAHDAHVPADARSPALKTIFESAVVKLLLSGSGRATDEDNKWPSDSHLSGPLVCEVTSNR